MSEINLGLLLLYYRSWFISLKSILNWVGDGSTKEAKCVMLSGLRKGHWVKLFKRGNLLRHEIVNFAYYVIHLFGVFFR